MRPRVLNSSKGEIYKPLRLLAIEMRKKPTEAEAKLWAKLERRQLGVKFRRQHIIDRFIVDFYCVEKLLVIEVDGDIHNEQKERDDEREQLLSELGCFILRFSNEEVTQNIEKVLSEIKEHL